MKRVLCILVLVSFFIGTTAIYSLASAQHEAHHTGGARPAAITSSQGMMGEQGVAQMPCMAEQTSGSMSKKMGMMGSGMHDMMGSGMHGMMEHMVFLDRATELGLSSEQVGKLKKLHSECRKDNIRNVAEAKIARLELTDLLDGDNWSLKDAEPLVRKAQKLEGDIQIRRLRAMSDARQVLTAEQLQQARSGGNSSDPESLFN